MKQNFNLARLARDVLTIILLGFFVLLLTKGIGRISVIDIVLFLSGMMILIWLVKRPGVEDTDKFAQNLENLGFVKKKGLWRRTVGDVELEAGYKMNVRPSDGWVFFMRSNIDYPKTFAIFCPRIPFIGVRRLGNLEEATGSQELAHSAENMFRTGVVGWANSNHWDEFERRGFLGAIGHIDLQSPYKREICVILNLSHLWTVVTIEESDIQAIADFFSALKRAGSR